MTPISPEHFADLLLAGAPHAARSAAISLADDGWSPRAIYLEVLAPALREIGARWEQGIVTVAQEHLATAVVSSIMAVLAPRLTEVPPVSRRVLLAGTADELHQVGLQMVSDFLEADGWEVLYVGAATPGADLGELVETLRPDVVALSTTLRTNLDHARSTVESLRSLAARPFILVGGQAYGGNPDDAARIGADAFAADAGQASALLRERFA